MLVRLWRRGQHGWPARFPVAQFPNAPLLVYFAAALIARASATLHDAAWAVSVVALTIWAYEELADGVNWFRRALGAVILVSIVIGLARGH
jgi:hypothetical protein